MASRKLRSLAIGVCLTALLAAAAPRLGYAQDARATIEGSEQANFGRMILTFPSMVETTARISNAVLVVNFSEPVQVAQIERIASQMPSYVSLARVDPDGRGVRFALTRNLRVNKLAAAERVFIDLLPPTWQGMPPSLPQEVVTELARRVQAAESQARTVARQVRQEVRDIDVRVSQLPTLVRLVFVLPQEAIVDAAMRDGGIDVGIGRGFRFEPARLRPLLPPDVALASAANENGEVRLRLEARDGQTIRHFREEEGFVIDIARASRQPVPQAQQRLAAEVQAAQQAARPDSAVAQAPAAAPAAQPQPAASAASRRPATELPAVAPAERRAEPPAPPQAVAVTAATSPEGWRLDFRFPRRTAAAAFRDGEDIVLVFDTIDRLDASAIAASATAFVSDAKLTQEARAAVLRLKAREAGVIRFAPDGNAWSLTAGDKGVAASALLRPTRQTDESGQNTLVVPLSGVSSIHWIPGESGEQLAVATAFGPGASLPKPHRFVEVRLDASMHGLVARPVADDVTLRTGVDHVAIGRAGGLTVSALGSAQAGPQAADPTKTGSIIDRVAWEQARMGDPRERMAGLIRSAAQAQRSERPGARLALATHLLANGLQVEALGPLDASLVEDQAARRDKRVHLSRAIALTMLHRSREAEAALQHELLKDDLEADLWRAVNEARQGKFPRANAAFRRASGLVDGYPEILQAMIRPDIFRTAVAMRDQATAERELQLLSEYAPVWFNREQIALRQAELDEMSGRADAALTGYKALFDAADRSVSARAQLKGIQLAHREQDKSIARDEAKRRLETVAITWRGDETEIEALGELGQMYIEDQRWRDAFHLARRATGVFPEHQITRRLHDEAAKHFEELFTGGKGDTIPRAEAVALFYDFKEFMPVGRRGDEIIRRLADRLVELDLLDQAAEMLQHQIDNRLQGAQRASVAARLAMVRLMNRQPAEALRALGNTRLAELPRDIRRARQLLEAKALSDLSRTDLALDILTDESGPEVDRLRADILWTARRWREAGEAHERILGEAWRKEEPLSERERADALRAAVAYVMSEEALAIDRLRTKFAAPMAQTPDARLFGFITGLDRARPGDLRELTRAVANADTLTEFMNEYRKRYPEMATSARGRPQAGGEPPAQPAGPAGPDAAAPAPGQPQRQAEGGAGERRG